MKKINKKIAVAVSGGVDSGTALALLKDEGHDLIAVFTDHFGCLQSEATNSCCSIESLRMARETAQYLDVPFYKFDFRKYFTERVVEPFVQYYDQGLTPNPCAWCNSRIRFSVLMDKLEAMGVEYMATGHYARIIDGKLYKAEDDGKDQSYFLYDIEKKRLNNIIFPLGEMNKSDVCSIARDKKLPVRKAIESQDLCVFMDDDLGVFLKDKTKIKNGDIVNLDGEIIGEHAGYQNYTIGQRKGLGGLGKKSYVVKIIPSENKIVAGGEQDIYCSAVRFKVSHPEDFSVAQGDRVKIKIRSTQPLTDCLIEDFECVSGICKVRFDVPQRLTAPGQLAVLYNSTEVVGGGEIVE
jgi:tRNA-specific 2-thiouridylase